LSKMNTTNVTESEKKESVDTFLITLYILVFVVGLLLNIYGMKCLVHNWKKLRIINILVLNLGLADMLYLLTHPFLVYYINKNDWIFGKGFCKVTRFCFKLNLYGSIGFLTCISVYRYLAIVHPIKVMGKLTVIHSVVISVVVWILASVGSLPDVIYPKQSGNNETCLPATDEEHIERYFIYNLIWTIFGFCIPFIIIVGCYIHVALKSPCPTWYDEVLKARHVSRGLVSLNCALNPLVYMCVSENISAQFRQLLQRCGQVFSCCFKQKSSSEPVPHTEEEAESAL
uniref:Si:dkey-78k11.9 n=1 Tax=Poecilia latipinna TaxID=48699 RepID=A0A3B3W2C2_9TELE